jgi:hypothetical protein
MNLPDLVHLMAFSRGVNIVQNLMVKISQLVEDAIGNSLV